MDYHISIKNYITILIAKDAGLRWRQYFQSGNFGIFLGCSDGCIGCYARRGTLYSQKHKNSSQEEAVQLQKSP